ncbi:hypothetical protein ACA910_004364 [Epithemia clementina (nom. ined.)]
MMRTTTTTTKSRTVPFHALPQLGRDFQLFYRNTKCQLLSTKSKLKTSTRAAKKKPEDPLSDAATEAPKPVSASASSTTKNTTPTAVSVEESAGTISPTSVSLRAVNEEATAGAKAAEETTTVPKPSNSTFATGPIALTPRAIRELFNSCMTTAGPLEQQMQKVQGYLQRSDRPKKSYNGYYYENLLDPNDLEVYLTLRIPQNMYAELFLSSAKGATPRSNNSVSGASSRQLVDVQGFVGRKISNNCSIQLVFEVTQASVMQTPTELSPQEVERLQLLRRRAYQPRDTSVAEILKRKLLKQEEPRILFVTGENSIVHQDVKQALGEDAATKYALSWVRVNLSKPGPLQQVLVNEALHKDEKSQVVDLIAIVRGGGDGLGVFNDPSLCEAALDCKVPIITALGHATDQSLLDDMADSNFTTPTKVGAWLKELVVNTQREMDTSELLIKEKVEKEQRQERERQKEAQSALLQQLEHGKQQSDRLAQDKRTLEEQLLQLTETSTEERQQLQQQLNQLTTESSKQREEFQQQLKQASQEVKRLCDKHEETVRRYNYAMIAGVVVAAAAVVFRVG